MTQEICSLNPVRLRSLIVVAIIAGTAQNFLLGANAFALINLKQVQISQGQISQQISQKESYDSKGSIAKSGAGSILQVDLLFDGNITKNQIRKEFINDVIQVVLNDVSVYPAKISSINNSVVTKIFAYQYTPKMVRCRLTVKGRAENFQNSLEVVPNGRILTLKLKDPASKNSITLGKSETIVHHMVHQVVHQVAHQAIEPQDEFATNHRINAKANTKEIQREIPRERPSEILGATNSKPDTSKPDIKDAQDAAEQLEEKKLLEKISGSVPSTISDTPIARQAAHPDKNPSNTTANNTSTGKPLLGAAKPFPSPFKAFAKMIAVLAIFGIVALALKKLASSKKGLLEKISKSGFARKGKFIEVLSTQYLGPKQSVAVVKIAGRVLVLGVSGDGISLITDISGTDFPADIPAAMSDMTATSTFKPFGNKAFSDLLTVEKGKPVKVSPALGIRSRIKDRIEGLKSL